MPAANVHLVTDVASALALLLTIVKDGDRVLCKASRRVALDRLVDRLLVELGGVGGHAAMECN